MCRHNTISNCYLHQTPLKGDVLTQACESTLPLCCQALGVMVVERCSINLEPLGDRPFVFSIGEIQIVTLFTLS